jgi:hypothetical protein
MLQQTFQRVSYTLQQRCAVANQETVTMTKKELNSSLRGNPPLQTRDEQPLLRVLVAEATRRGDTLAMLAKYLGVTYTRLAQWRRNEAAISHAHRKVHENAGRYLGIPTVLVLVMSGLAGLNEFIWPTAEPLNDRVAREIERLKLNPFLGAFVPADIDTATPAIRLFVVFLAHEIQGDSSKVNPSFQWLRALHQAAAGNVEGQLTVDTLHKKGAQDTTIF